MISNISNQKPIIEGRNISKYFGGVTALNNVDFIVYPGEIVGLIGPNGSGKTTLVDCLSRMQNCSQGQVVFKDVEITRKKPYQVAHMGLARTFQVVRVYREISVLENMLLSQQWRGKGLLKQLCRSTVEMETRAREILQFLTLINLIEEKAGNLSVGQQRLLEIGMALMPNPDLLFLDEATTGINPTLIKTIKDRIRDLNQEFNTTFVLIEHNMLTIADLCERVFVLNQGEKLIEGTPEVVFNDDGVIEAYFGTRFVGHGSTNDDKQ
jgi:branched-chain amino acid transport system ATP-binding protein